MKGRLEGKVAIVVGAGTRGEGVGNGKAAAITFAREGAKVAAFFASDDSSYVTGLVIPVDGGLILHI